MPRTLCGLAFVASVSSVAIASTSSFNSTTDDLGGGSYQLVDEFEILYSGEFMYVDMDLDNNPESSIFIGGPDLLGVYHDPEHYRLDFGNDLMPYYLGSELSSATPVEWRLTYAVHGMSILYSTILSGTTTDNGDGTWTLDIALGLEWPVKGVPKNEFGIPRGTHVAAAIADFNSFTWDGETLSANVPAPSAWTLLLLGIGASRRRRR